MLVHLSYASFFALLFTCWAPDKNYCRSSMAYRLFVNSATFVFLRHATLSKMVALSMAALKLMVLAGCSCVFV